MSGTCALERDNRVLALASGAELAAPEPDAFTHVIVGAAQAVVAVRTLIDDVGDDIDGKDLAAVGVARELEVHTGTFALFQMIGLVVEQYDGMAQIQIAQYFRRWLAMAL